MSRAEGGQRNAVERGDLCSESPQCPRNQLTCPSQRQTLPGTAQSKWALYDGIISRAQGGPRDCCGTAISRSESPKCPRNQMECPSWHYWPSLSPWRRRGGAVVLFYLQWRQIGFYSSCLRARQSDSEATWPVPAVPQVLMATIKLMKDPVACSGPVTGRD
jgi:hypothetical protein